MATQNRLSLAGDSATVKQPTLYVRALDAREPEQRACEALFKEEAQCAESNPRLN